ncbi:MAG: aspartate-semialdehyde dehydrogenase [Thermoplasmata archaeon]
MSTRRLPVAILGAGGYIGQHFVRLLADHPDFEIRSLAGGPHSASHRLSELWQISAEPPEAFAEMRIGRTDPARLLKDGVAVVFSALPSGTAGPIESDLARRGLHVFTNAADHRMDPDVPLLIPEVNAPHLTALPRRHPGLLVANANCTTTGLVLALAPILPLTRPAWVSLASYQALSGAGLPGVASLHVADNVVPYIPQEEEKVASESRRILGHAVAGRVRDRPIPFLAQCVRVPVRDGHLEAITLKARARPTREALLEAFERFDPIRRFDLPSAPRPPLQIRKEPDRPQPILDRWAGTPERARGMAVVVGRVRWDPPYLRFFSLSHNAVRGGAGGSVLNAELALRKGLLGNAGPEAPKGTRPPRARRLGGGIRAPAISR